MIKYTTADIAEKLGTQRQNVNYYIREGYLKAEIKILKYNTKSYLIDHKSFLEFLDFYLDGLGKTKGPEKIPPVWLYDENPSLYSNKIKKLVERDRKIINDRFVHKMKFKDLHKKYKMAVISLRGIIKRNLEEEEEIY